MDKQPFSILLRQSEREILRILAREIDRSQSAAVRLLIRQEAQRRGLWPIPSTPRPTPAGAEVRP